MPSSSPRRTCLASLAVALTVASDGAAATRQTIIPAGKFSAPDGRPASETNGKVKHWVLTEKLHEQVKRMAVAGGRDICVDYEHALVKKLPKGEKAIASGWVPVADYFAALSWDDQGGLIADIHWTPAAAQHIRDREYKYLSPVFFYDDSSGEVLGLHSIALTNNPALSQLAVAALSAELGLAHLPIPNPPPQGEGTPAYPDNNFEGDNTVNLAVALRAALGVAETTTEESLLTHVASLSVREPDPTKYVSLAALSAEQSAHATVRTQLAALQTQINTAALDAEIKTAREAGAVLTAEYEADVRRIADQMGVPVAKSMLSALPRAAALAGKTQTGGMVPSGAAAAGGAQGATAVLSASQKTMCAILGVQEDQYINEVERLKRVTVAQTGDDDNG